MTAHHPEPAGAGGRWEDGVVATITTAERRARLARRHRLAPADRAADVEEAARSIVCLHATNHATVHLSAWARVGDLRREDVDRALFADRTLVKQMAMRRTLFVFPRATVPAAVHGSGRRVAAAEERTLIRDVEAAGLHADGARWLEEAAAHVVDHLSDGRPESWTELRGSVPLLAGTISYGEGRRWGRDMPVGPRVLTMLSARGEIVRAGIDGGWMTSRPRWASMASWLGAAVGEVEPDRAREELVTGWLRAFGPGTEQDIKWWLGDTLTNTRSALRAIGAVAVDLEDGGRGYVLPDDLEPTEPVEPWAALLPALDPATMGWYDRDWYLGPYRSLLFDTAGNGGTTAWWNGRIVGAWHQPADGRVVVHLLEDIGRQGTDALAEEAERLTTWLDGARPGARWPSPLLASLGRRA